jgi:hypothetical protein
VQCGTGYFHQGGRRLWNYREGLVIGDLEDRLG